MGTKKGDYGLKKKISLTQYETKEERQGLELGDHQWSKIKNKSTPFITIYSNV
jgi:hypothetical protein